MRTYQRMDPPPTTPRTPPTRREFGAYDSPPPSPPRVRDDPLLWALVVGLLLGLATGLPMVLG